MANTYTQLHIQIVFATFARQCLIAREHAAEIEMYITGIVQARKKKLLAVSCQPDHAHIFIGLNPAVAISDLVGTIKTGSCNFINEKGWVQGHFSWQKGFGAFSYSKKEVPRVIAYIRNQEQHHQRREFRKEYLSMLDEFGVAYDMKYVFDPGNGDVPK
jgi:REP element-mobilizing transposase RayT